MAQIHVIIAKLNQSDNDLKMPKDHQKEYEIYTVENLGKEYKQKIDGSVSNKSNIQVKYSKIY